MPITSIRSSWKEQKEKFALSQGRNEEETCVSTEQISTFFPSSHKVANGTSGSQRIVLQVDIFIVPAHTCAVIAPWLNYYDMGWTTEDPMFDPPHRQVSRPDSCLLGCDDVLLGVSRGSDGTECLLLGILDL
jgi:hypothetical protein